jgi:glycosyltransferase involved in cell wall biosynthesis
VKGFSLVKDNRIKLLVRTQKPLEQYPEDMLGIINTDKRIIAETKDVPENTVLYDDGDIYLYPARYDGQALVAAEAMACGFPIFVTDAPPMNEFSNDKRFMIKSNVVDTVKLKDHEVNLNVCDVNDLADKIRWSINEDLTDVGKHNRATIEENHSWKTWHDAYAKIFGVL